MEIYLRVFVNSEKNNWAKSLLMVELVYNNAKNTSTSHISFKFNYSYYLYLFFENKEKSCSKSCSTNKLAKKLKSLIAIFQQNLFYIQKPQKRVYDKEIKPRSYISNKKVWLNSKHIWTK